MRSDWRKVKFNAVCDIWRGGSPRPIHEFIANTGIPWVKIADATSANSRFIHRTKEFIRPEGKTKSREVHPGDLILSNSATPGMPMFVAIDACIHDGWLLLRNFEGIDKLFCYYLLLYEQPKIVRQGSGTIFTNLKTDILKNHIVNLPPLPEQRAIAHILGSLDDKIELNRKMSETLEAIAQVIFKSWFIDFDPVHKKAEGRQPVGMDVETADLFPDSFEDSELGKIPSGWRISSLDKISNFLNGVASQKYPPTDDDSLPVIKIAELRRGVTEKTGRANTTMGSQYVVDDGDVLFSWSGSLMLKIWCGGKGVLNQHLFKVTSEEYPKWFFYFWTRQHLPDFQAIAAGKVTTMGHIKRHHLSDAQVVLPPNPVIQKGSEVITPMIDALIASELQSRNLAVIRKTLLSKLLSGEIRIKDVAKFVEKFA